MPCHSVILSCLVGHGVGVRYRDRERDSDRYSHNPEGFVNILNEILIALFSVLKFLNVY